MTSNYQQNAITRRLDRLVEMWGEFKENPEARICRWHVLPDEYSMIEAFYEREASQGGMTSDIFLRFDQEFDGKEKYGKALYNAFIGMIEADKEQLAAEGISIAFQAKDLIKNNHNSQLFTYSLQSFAEQNGLSDQLVVAYLTPKENISIEKWTEWLMDSQDMEIPPNVKFMIVDTVDQPIFDELAKLYPDHIYTIKPFLDMEAAMKELAASGNRTDPGVQYRMAFVSLTQAVGQKDWEGIKKYTDEAVGIAEKQAWPHLVATAYMTAASGEVSGQKFDEALMNYQKAEAITEQAYRAGEEACGKLVVQALFGQGTVYVAQQKLELAFKVYERAARQAEVVKDPYYLMEAWRMAGYCYERSTYYEDAWECNQKAFLASMELEPENLPHSTLPFIGKALIRAGNKLGKHKEVFEVEDQMETLLGKEWQDLAKR